jgi:cell division protein DivIC
VNPRRIIALLYIVLLTAFGFGAGALYLDARAEYNALQQTQAASRANLAAARARLFEQERTLERLKSDSQFVEKMIRKRLGYARPGEVIFRFED